MPEAWPARARARDLGAARRELLAQAVGELEHAPADRVHAELEQQVDRGAQREDARRVGRALLEAARARLELQVIAVEVQVVGDAAPADHARRELREQARGGRRTGRSPRPRAATCGRPPPGSRRGTRRRRAGSSRGSGSRPRRRARRARGTGVRAPGGRCARRCRTRPRRARAGACAGGGAPPRRSPAGAARRGCCSITVSTPRERRLHHAYTFEGYSRSQVTTRSPRCQSSPAGDQAEPLAGVLREGDLVGAGADQRGGAPAHALDLGVVDAR